MSCVKAMATPAILYSHWQLDILKAVLPQNEGGCTCSHVFAISATFCEKFSSMNILQHCPSDFVAKPAPGYTCSILVSQFLQHQKKCCAASITVRREKIYCESVVFESVVFESVRQSVRLVVILKTG